MEVTAHGQSVVKPMSERCSDVVVRAPQLFPTTETGREAKFYGLTDEGEKELDAAQVRYVGAMAQILDPVEGR